LNSFFVEGNNSIAWKRNCTNSIAQLHCVYDGIGCIYLVGKGHQVHPAYHRTRVRGPDIGTPTFIVTNDTAVNSPLTPSRVGLSKQGGTCPLFPSRFFLSPSFSLLFFVVSIDKCFRLFAIDSELSRLEFSRSVGSSRATRNKQLRQRDSGGLTDSFSCSLLRLPEKLDETSPSTLSSSLTVPGERRRISFTPLTT